MNPYVKHLLPIAALALITSCGDLTSDEKINHVDFDIEAHEENYQKFLEAVPEKYSYTKKISGMGGGDAGRIYVSNGIVDSIVIANNGGTKTVEDSIQHLLLDSVFDEVSSIYYYNNGKNTSDFNKLYVYKISCDYDSIYHFPLSWYCYEEYLVDESKILGESYQIHYSDLRPEGDEKINHVDFDIEAHQENYQKFLELVPEKYSFRYDYLFCLGSDDAGRVYVTNGVVDSFVKMPVDTTWGYRKEIRTENVQRFSLDSVFGKIHDDYYRYEGIDLNNSDFWVYRINCDYDSVYHYPSKHSYRFEQNPNSNIEYDADFDLYISDLREENGTVEKADTFDLAVHTKNYEKFRDVSLAEYSYLYRYEDEEVHFSCLVYAGLHGVDSVGDVEYVVKDSSLYMAKPWEDIQRYSIDSVFETTTYFYQYNTILQSEEELYRYDVHCDYDSLYHFPTISSFAFVDDYETENWSGEIVHTYNVANLSYQTISEFNVLSTISDTLVADTTSEDTLTGDTLVVDTMSAELAAHEEKYRKFLQVVPEKYSYLYTVEDKAIRYSKRVYVTRKAIDKFGYNIYGDHIDSTTGYEEIPKDTMYWSSEPYFSDLPYSMDSVFVTMSDFYRENDSLESDAEAYVHEIKCEYDSVYHFPILVEHIYKPRDSNEKVYSEDTDYWWQVHTFSDFREE